MRRSIPAFAFVFLLFGSALLSAAPHSDFDKIVDFSVTLKSLSAAASGSVPLPTGRMVFLSGTVSDVTILDAKEATFKVRIEIITGEWIGTEDVKAYASYVEFTGPEFFAVFPARAPRTATPGVIAANSRVLVVAKPTGIITTPTGEKQVLLDGAYIRSTE
jgi:hypothetical protein